MTAREEVQKIWKEGDVKVDQKTLIRSIWALAQRIDKLEEKYEQSTNRQVDLPQV